MPPWTDTSENSPEIKLKVRAVLLQALGDCRTRAIVELCNCTGSFAASFVIADTC